MEVTSIGEHLKDIMGQFQGSRDWLDHIMEFHNCVIEMPDNPSNEVPHTSLELF